MSKAFRQISALLVVAVMLVLLSSMLTGHGVDHHGVDMFFVSLVPIFLFGTVVRREIASFWFSTSYLPLKPLFVPPFLFQLPPPSESY